MTGSQASKEDFHLRGLVSNLDWINLPKKIKNHLEYFKKATSHKAHYKNVKKNLCVTCLDVDMKHQGLELSKKNFIDTILISFEIQPNKIRKQKFKNLCAFVEHVLYKHRLLCMVNWLLCHSLCILTKCEY